MPSKLDIQININGLLRIAEDNFWDKINNQFSTSGGVYKVIAVKDEQRIPIRRFLSIDKSGTLYIGKATSYLKRVIDLKKSISPNYRGSAHICGRRYKSNPRISIQFPIEILYIELIQSDSPKELESKLLLEYKLEFGEVPPLNAI